MKILQLTSSLGGGGAERIAVSLCNRYAANPADEIVLVSILDDSLPENAYYKSELSPRVRHINLHGKTGLEPKALWRLFRIIGRERPNVVHGHVSAIPLFFPAVFYRDIRFFNTIHTLAERHNANAGLLKRILTRYLFLHNRVTPITISDTCHQSYVKTYRAHNDICITNGSGPLQTTDRLRSVEQEVAALKKSPETTVFIHVGRNHPVKNHGRLFDAFSRLEAEGTDFILLVLGSEYEPWEAPLKASRRIFLLGPKTNVGDYMAQADYFVLSSDFEGLPMTLLEAMSMGVVPVSTPAGGVVDVIEDGTTGYLSEGFEGEAFYRKLRQALLEKGRISRETVKSCFEHSFSMETCAKKYYRSYLDACNKS